MFIAALVNGGFEMFWAITIYLIITIAMLVEGAGILAFLWPLVLLVAPYIFYFIVFRR
jgi:hypothetical protein